MGWLLPWVVAAVLAGEACGCMVLPAPGLLCCMMLELAQPNPSERVSTVVEALKCIANSSGLLWQPFLYHNNIFFFCFWLLKLPMGLTGKHFAPVGFATCNDTKKEQWERPFSTSVFDRGWRVVFFPFSCSSSQSYVSGSFICRQSYYNYICM